MKKLLLIKILLILIILIINTLNARTLNKILDSGYLIIGIRNIPSEIIYQPDSNEKKGFCYELAESFADYLDVNLKIKIVAFFEDYWSKDGINVLKNNTLETPDIYNDIDIVADIITVTEERMKIVNMVPFIENAELFFTRINEKINSPKDFIGKRIITAETFNYYNTVINFLETNNLDYVINKIKIDEVGNLKYINKYTEPSKNQVELLIFPNNSKFDRYSFYFQVMLNNADISILDSFSFFSKIYNTLSIKNNIKPLFIANNTGYLSFCTSYDTPELNKSLEEFITHFKNSKRFDLLFKKYTGFEYNEYLKLLMVK
jgi:membrane-bound lytic murein transglycosylase MltF